jgi:hypothetical protein
VSASSTVVENDDEVVVEDGGEPGKGSEGEEEDSDGETLNAKAV